MRYTDRARKKGREQQNTDRIKKKKKIEERVTVDKILLSYSIICASLFLHFHNHSSL